MTRLLLLSCSDRKRPETAPLPALERYDGPLWRVLRRFLQAQPIFAADLQVAALSAEYGLIDAQTPIPPYDRRMTGERAAALHPQVMQTLVGFLTPPPVAVCLALSQVYLEALRGWEAILPDGRVTVTDGPVGTKQSQLRAWLEQRSWQPTAPQERALPTTPRGDVVISGVHLRLTPEAVLAHARAALAANPQGADQYRDWYVPLDEQRIAPKWLVSQLSGLPVTAFDAAAARRVLHGLGIAVKRVAE